MKGRIRPLLLVAAPFAEAVSAGLSGDVGQSKGLPAIASVVARQPGRLFSRVNKSRLKGGCSQDWPPYNAKRFRCLQRLVAGKS
jgi:hypothetical protein